MFLKEQDRGEESECDLLTRDCTLQIILSAQNTLHAIPSDKVFKLPHWLNSFQQTEIRKLCKICCACFLLTMKIYTYLPTPMTPNITTYADTVDITSGRNHKNVEEKNSFSSPVPNLDVTNQLWQSKWKHNWIMNVCIWWQGPQREHEGFFPGPNSLTVKNSPCVSCPYAQNSSTMKK